MISRGEHVGGRDGTQREARRARLAAPEDCTESGRLSAFVGAAVRSLRMRPVEVVIDLSPVRRMNCALLASIVFLARECRRAGAALRLVGAGPLFEAWATTHGLMRHMQAHMDGRPE